MAALDRFGGPESWDLHCYEQDMEREQILKWATCLDCSHCVQCDIVGYEDIGYCTEGGYFVMDDDTPDGQGCEVFSI